MYMAVETPDPSAAFYSSGMPRVNVPGGDITGTDPFAHGLGRACGI